MPKKTTSDKVVKGLGIAALTAGAAAAAAAYYFSGTEGKKRRKVVSAWAKQAQSDMLKKMKGMKDVSKKAYDQAASEVLAKYKQAKNIDPKELQQFGMELKSHWDEISKHATKLVGKMPKAKVKKSVKAKAHK
jgi:hypothetical protein